MAKIGTLVAGKYEILREIGRGGMSVVYLAMDTHLNKQWAIKEISRRSSDANNDIVVSSLLAEANLMKKLDHSALPRIVDIIEEANTIYVVMDYIEGEPLSKILELYGAQDQDTVIEWGKQLCDVLFYLHNCEPPIIYRDMKPANVMLKPDGNVKLIDFGIAREYKRSKTADTDSLGTRGYAAPEQFGGKGQTDARTDIYSFGVTLYHLVTGKNPCEPPYELYPIKQINPNFYDGLQYLIQKCINMNPADRFQSCDEIRYVLDNIHEFDKGRRLVQGRKYKAFITMIILSAFFVIMGAGSIGMFYSAVQASFDENIAIIENTANGIQQLNTSLNNITGNTEFSTAEKLQASYSYLSTLYEMYLDDPTVLSSSVYKTINIENCWSNDNSKKTDDGSAVDYTKFTTEEKSNLAGCYYYLGCLYFDQIADTSAAGSSATSARNFLSYIVSETKLNLVANDAEYDLSIITENDINRAQALYYISNYYAYSLSSAKNDDSTLARDDASEGAVVSNKDFFSQITESMSILEKDISDATKVNIFNAYAKYLNNKGTINELKSAGIADSEINELYEAIYGENYESVYNQGIQQFGADITSAEMATLVPSNPIYGVYAITEKYEANLSQTKGWRFVIAQNIHDVYAAN